MLSEINPAMYPMLSACMSLVCQHWFQVFLVGLVSCCLLVHCWQNTTLQSGETSKAPRPPGPWGLPIIGNLAQLGRMPHRKLTMMWRKYGDVYRLQLGSRPTVVLNGLETVRQALIKQSEDFAGRPDFYTFNFIANGKSMGFSDYGLRWKLHRRIAQNALSMFINSADNPMEKNIQQEAEVLVQFLQKASRDAGNSDGSSLGPIDPHQEIYLSVGNIICALCFGKRYRRDDPDFLQLVRNNDEFMAFAGAGNPVDLMPWMRLFTKRSLRRFVAILGTMDRFCLQKRHEHLETYDPSNMRDATDALLRASEQIPAEEKERVGLTDEHILTTVQEIIGAGFDTIATTLQWSLLLMAAHPDVQKRVHAEVDSTLGRRQLPGYRDAYRLPYTEAVLLETMRFSCIFPLALPHSTTRDTLINGYFVPDKTLIFVNLWSITRDETKFPKPDMFDPNRFLVLSDSNQASTISREGTNDPGLGEQTNGNTKSDWDQMKENSSKTAGVPLSVGPTPGGSKLNKVADLFLPFGAGRRKCPGELLARMELFLFFTSLMQKCSVAFPPGISYSLESKYGLTLKPKDFKVVIKPRD